MIIDKNSLKLAIKKLGPRQGLSGTFYSWQTCQCSLIDKLTNGNTISGVLSLALSLLDNLSAATQTGFVYL